MDKNLKNLQLAIGPKKFKLVCQHPQEVNISALLNHDPQGKGWDGSG